MHRTKEVRISSIVLPKPYREIGEVCDLVESISRHGVLSPIAITPDKVLIYGAHRVKACSLLMIPKIPAIVLDVDDTERELITIDENLARYNLSQLEQSEQLKRRKQLYESLHPETRKGGDKKSKAAKSKRNDFASFTEDTARKTGKTARSIQQDVQIGENLADDVKDAIRDLPQQPGKTKLLELSRLEPVEQRAEVERMKAEADKPKPKKQMKAKPTPEPESQESERKPERWTMSVDEVIAGIVASYNRRDCERIAMEITAR